MYQGVVGVETEFGLGRAMLKGRAAWPSDIRKVPAILLEPFPRLGKGTQPSLWLENGARFYLDMERIPEVATPECDSVVDLVAHDKALERFIEAQLVLLNEVLDRRGWDRAVMLKRNSDCSSRRLAASTNAGVLGCHENYSIPHGMGTAQGVAEKLCSFLLARQLFCGAGDVVQQGTPGYALSQRAPFLFRDVAQSSTSQRPLVSIRNDSHSSNSSRLHVICGDSNMLEGSTFLKVGVTRLIVQLACENPDGLPIFADLIPANLNHAVIQISRDTTFRKRLEFLHRTTRRSVGGITALEILWGYLEALETHFRGSTGETRQILDGFRFVLEQFGPQGSPSPIEGVYWRLSTKVDWALKYHLLQQRADAREGNWTAPVVKAVDLSYHTVDTAHSELYQVQAKMQARGLPVRVCSDEQIVDALQQAPPTRAALRGECMRRINADEREDFIMDWDSLHLREGYLMFRDPLRTEDPRLMEFLETQLALPPLKPVARFLPDRAEVGG